MTSTSAPLRTSTPAAFSAAQVGPRATLHGSCIKTAKASNPRRTISPINGRALEALGHAIEYLADEFALHAGSLTPLRGDDPQIRSIQILMAASRTVYYECPITPSLRERLRGSLFAALGKWNFVNIGNANITTGDDNETDKSHCY
jgi:hypothetical protein